MNLAVPTFETPHASFQGIEEMLNVQGVTPEIFYGTYVPAPEGAPVGAPRLEARPGLVDCLSVFGAKDSLDVNTAQPAVLAALGVPPDTIEAIVERRRQMPFTPKDIGVSPSAERHSLRSGRQLNRDHSRHGAGSVAERWILRRQAHRRGHGEIHAAGLRFADSRAALVRHGVLRYALDPRALPDSLRGRAPAAGSN